jgi:capsular polysaccharide biosynthesis protein
MAATFIRRFAYRVALTAFIAVWIITFAIRTYDVFFRPTCYESMALIKLEGATSNQDLMQRQVEVIRSPAILNPVIEQLDLNKFWVECFGLPFGFQIKTPELWEMLTNQLNVTVVYSSPLIKIESYSEKAAEAALIANGVAESYRNFMVKNQKQIQVQIVDRAQPALQPWKQADGAALVGLAMVIATFYGAFASGAAILGMIFLRKLLAVKIAGPVASNFTGAPIKPKY